MTAIIVSVLAGLFTAAMLFYILFGDWEEFCDCVKFYFTPEFWSALQGKYWDDRWAEIKLNLWLMVSFGVGFLVYVNMK